MGDLFAKIDGSALTGLLVRLRDITAEAPPWSREDACSSPTLLCGIAQNRFECGVEIAPHLRHTLIAILAKEGRWLVIFKYAAALLVLEKSQPAAVRREQRGADDGSS